MTRTQAPERLLDAIASQIAQPGDYLSRLRNCLSLLQGHFGAQRAAIRLYNGHQAAGIFTLVLPENRFAPELEALFQTAFMRQIPLVHRPDRQTRYGILSMPDFPAMAAPVMAHGQPIAVVVLAKHQGLNLDLADLAALDQVLPLLSAVIEEAVMQRSMIAGYLKTIEALALALEAKDPYTRGHSNMVAAYSLAIAERIGLNDEEQEILALGAIMHDLGKIGIPDHVLTKPGALTTEEFDLMKKHPEIGEQILKPLDHNYLDRPRQIVRSHHERLDGRGYPDGLIAAEIPLLVRIVSIADAWDAMTSDRPYRAALAYEVAARELLRRSGDMWDPDLVREHLAIVFPEALVSLDRAAA
ncbi:MAG: hypothetical protein GEEBNDBF_00424 [bacterium]|nr:hypothetical protein [bacterium]